LKEIVSLVHMWLASTVHIGLDAIQVIVKHEMK